MTAFLIEAGRDVIYKCIDDLGGDNNRPDFLHDYDYDKFSSMTAHEKYLAADDFNGKMRDGFDRSFYTKFYQKLGNDIRSYGCVASALREIDPESIQAIPKFIVKLINEHRANPDAGKCYYVVDAIRNPFEAIYLKDRFSAFYMIGVTAKDSERKDRLLKDGLEYFDLAEVDYREGADIDNIDIDTENKEKIKKQNKRPTGRGALVVQNVAACLEKCDIYIDNPSDFSFSRGFNNPSHVAGNIVNYVALMQRPGLVTPTAIERCMQIALTAKLNSGCLSRQVGAAICDDKYSILSIGWNDVARGQVSCLLRNASYFVNGHDSEAYSDYELKNDVFRKKIKLKVESLGSGGRKRLGGRVYSYCFKQVYNEITGVKNQVHTRALHAEENAFLQLAMRGVGGVDSGFLFTTASPCELCSKKAYQMGISKIYYIDPYPGIATSNILQSGSNRPELVLFSGAVGRAFHQLYHPVMPYKDEIEYLLS